MSASSRFHRRCRWLRFATLFVLLVLVSLLIFGASGLPWLRHDNSADTGITRVLLLVHLLPWLGYLWALWAVQRALADLAAGQIFQTAVARAIRHIGLGVLMGALLSVFAVTNLSRWIVGGQGGYAYFDLSGIVLGVVGAALLLLAQVIDQARALQTELDEIL